MERILTSIFDYQRFARNSRLDSLIAQTERRCSEALEDELWMVNAAGIPEGFAPEGSAK